MTVSCQHPGCRNGGDSPGWVCPEHSGNNAPNDLADRAVGRCHHVDLNEALQRGGHDYLCASCCRDAIDGAQTDERIAQGELLLRAESAEAERDRLALELRVEPVGSEAAGCVPCFACNGFRLPGTVCQFCLGAREERDRLASDKALLVRQVVDLTAERDALREALAEVAMAYSAGAKRVGDAMDAARALLSATPAAPKGDKP